MTRGSDTPPLSEARGWRSNRFAGAMGMRPSESRRPRASASMRGRAMLADCPSPETLARYRRGELDDQEAIGVQVHLEGCPACRAWVQEAPAAGGVGASDRGQEPAISRTQSSDLIAQGPVPPAMSSLHPDEAD